MLIFPTLKLSPLQGMAGMAGGVVSRTILGVGGGPLQIGDFYEGGYFAGYISQNANCTATHGLIVAPAASGYNGKSTLQQKTSNTETSGTSNLYDGATNTANSDDSDHPAASYCAGLTINSYSDWYLPAEYELQIAYYNLKPTTASNTTSDGNNPYAVPARSGNFTTGDPAQTSVSAFQSGGAQAFVADKHWASSQTPIYGYRIDFTDGSQQGQNSTFDKTNTYYVRAFRKFSV